MITMLEENWGVTDRDWPEEEIDVPEDDSVLQKLKRFFGWFF